MASHSTRVVCYIYPSLTGHFWCKSHGICITVKPHDTMLTSSHLDHCSGYRVHSAAAPEANQSIAETAHQALPRSSRGLGPAGQPDTNHPSNKRMTRRNARRSQAHMDVHRSTLKYSGATLGGELPHGPLFKLRSITLRQHFTNL